jgi:hypothetical protein
MPKLPLLLFSAVALALAGCDGDTTIVVASGTRPPTSEDGSGGAVGGFIIVNGDSRGQRLDSQPAQRPPEPRILEAAPAAPQGAAVPVPALGVHARALATLLLAGIAAWHPLTRRAASQPATR